MSDTPTLTPRLIVSSTANAIEFYRKVFGATELERYATPSGQVVHASISIRGAVVTLADAHDGWYPEPRPEGSPFLLTLACDDPDGLAKRAEEHGASILIPVADQFYGRREGRIRDPFGHLWILSKSVTKMSAEEIQRGVDAFGKS